MAIDITAAAQEALDESLVRLRELGGTLSRLRWDVTKHGHTELGHIQANLDTTDVILGLAYGVLGGVFSTQGLIKEFLHRIHSQASVERPKTLMGGLLHHYQDDIDKIMTPTGRVFVNRAGGAAAVHYHRLLRGHDPFSIHGDNPFLLMTKSATPYGIVRGLVRVLQHLVADTFSKQGLPLPFHSFFDYQRDGQISNWLIQIASKVKVDSGTTLRTDEVYARLLTIRMQDILASGLTWALCQAHLAVRGISDETRARQLRVIGYSSAFLTAATIGICQAGVPYISWPTLSLLLREVYQLLSCSRREMRALEAITDGLRLRDSQLEQVVFETWAQLPPYKTGEEYAAELGRGAAAISSLTSLFEEE